MRRIGAQVRNYFFYLPLQTQILLGNLPYKRLIGTIARLHSQQKTYFLLHYHIYATLTITFEEFLVDDRIQYLL